MILSDLILYSFGYITSFGKFVKKY